MIEHLTTDTDSHNPEWAANEVQAQFETAAKVVFEIAMKERDQRSESDYRVITQERDTLMRFKPEQMGSDFGKRVADLVRQCNGILNEVDSFDLAS